MRSASGTFREQIEICRRERIEGLWEEAATGLACLAAHDGDAERAATFIGFGEAMPGLPVANGDRQVRDRLVAKFIAPAREALGERAWKRSAAAGAAMAPDELCEFMLDQRTAGSEHELVRARPGSKL